MDRAPARPGAQRGHAAARVHLAGSDHPSRTVPRAASSPSPLAATGRPAPPSDYYRQRWRPLPLPRTATAGGALPGAPGSTTQHPRDAVTRVTARRQSLILAIRPARRLVRSLPKTGLRRDRSVKRLGRQLWTPKTTGPERPVAGLERPSACNDTPHRPGAPQRPQKAAIRACAVP